jgi:hypothetical protein
VWYLTLILYYLTNIVNLIFSTLLNPQKRNKLLWNALSSLYQLKPDAADPEFNNILTSTRKWYCKLLMLCSWASFYWQSTVHFIFCWPIVPGSPNTFQQYPPMHSIWNYILQSKQIAVQFSINYQLRCNTKRVTICRRMYIYNGTPFNGWICRYILIPNVGTEEFWF